MTGFLNSLTDGQLFACGLAAAFGFAAYAVLVIDLWRNRSSRKR